MKLLLPLILLFQSLLISASSLLAVDYGTDGFKASLIKPGIPFDVLINKDSKRKTPSLVTMRGEERAFGGEAANLATRFPKETFSSIKLLLGHPSTHPHSSLHQSLFLTPPSTTTRNSPAISSYPVEEILAMQLTYAKEMAEEVAGEKVWETVISVPAWFGVGERMAVLDAVELAGLRSIGLVNDGTAAAVNYAMTRSFGATPTYHLLYDFGASSLTTTLVSFKSALLPDPMSLAAKPELKNVTSLAVHGVGFDLHVGGYVFDGIVRDILVEEFENGAGKGKGVKKDLRAMAKLLKEAGRVKQVLSANSESIARIESLIDDTDLRVTVTREEFEKRASHLLEKYIQPIHDAFQGTNITLNEVESVILIGGSSRVPMVEAAVKAVVGEAKIAKNLNADEAAVMGAALYGAGLSRGFRTKDIRVQDVTPYGIDVSYEADKASESAEPRIIKTHLFPPLAKTGVKKTMTFKKTSDFTIQFSYRKTDDKHEIPDALFETTITGLEAAFTNLTEEAIANATVKVTIELNESNIVSVTKAVVVLREDDDTATPSFNEKLSKLLGKFGSKPASFKSSSSSTPGSTETPDPDSPKVDDPFSGEDAEATKAKLEELMRLATPVNSTVKLTTTTVPLERVPMTADDKTEARKRLREVKAVETRKLAREEARNVLEAYIYKVRDLVDQPSFKAASLESERKVIEEKNEAANEWLWDEADQAPTKDLKDKKSELEKLVKHVTVRSAEANERPRAVDAFNAILLSSDGFLTSAKTNNTVAEKKKDLPKYTPEELESFAKLKTEAAAWFHPLVKKQEGLKSHEDPVLRVADLEKKAKEIQAEMGKLLRKKAPRKPKVKASSSSSTSTSSSSTASGTATEEAVPEPTEGERKRDEL